MGNAHDHGHGQAHEHGTMDISVQERTFAGTLTAMKWGVILSIVILVFLAVFNA